MTVSNPYQSRRRFGKNEAALMLALAVAALAGMAYCHISDVGNEFDEHVYYMAGLFCCNIAVSVALIPALVIAERKPLERGRRALWAGAAALAAATIVGFVWSRTVGFPQMADHIGQWDALGSASLAFESLLVVVSLSVLRGPVSGTRSLTA